MNYRFGCAFFQLQIDLVENAEQLVPLGSVELVGLEQALYRIGFQAEQAN